MNFLKRVLEWDLKVPNFEFICEDFTRIFKMKSNRTKTTSGVVVSWRITSHLWQRPILTPLHQASARLMGNSSKLDILRENFRCSL